MSETADKDQVFLIAWTPEKLEWCLDLTNYSRRFMWEAIKGNEPISVTSLLHHGIIRTDTINDIEVYSITTVSGTKQREIVSLFNSDQDSAKQLIRNSGRKLYSKVKDLYEDRS
jgi:hypothetical protein